MTEEEKRQVFWLVVAIVCGIGILIGAIRDDGEAERSYQRLRDKGLTTQEIYELGK